MSDAHQPLKNRIARSITRICIDTLERRVLLAFNPSGREQEALEYINRMRMNPKAEYNLLVNSTDENVQNALDHFNVNLTYLQSQFNALSAAPPLAWNANLTAAALAHSNAMLAADTQSHQVPGEASLATRTTNAGYSDYSTVGENVYAYSEGTFYAHAGFAIDWGVGFYGVQSPPGHRNNIMSAAFREVGISIIDATAGKDVGPMLTTQDFGSRFSFGNPFFLGVVYDDKNSDGYYQDGEGISGATIKLSRAGVNYTTTSMTAGGYQIQVPNGTYSITVSGGSLGGTITSSVTFDSDNEKMDFKTSQISSAVLTNGLLKIDGTDGNDTISLINSGDNLRLMRNGVATFFTAADVNRIEIYAYDGNDIVDWSGIAKNVYIDAGTGNDSVTAGAGTDTLTGGAGKDTLKGGDGNDRVNGFGTPDQLFGEGGDDRIYGGEGDDFMDGGGGVDRIFGEAGADTLTGGSSADKLYGGIGNDFLQGGTGNDLLTGDEGNDTLFGNDGNDTFAAKDGFIDQLNGGAGTDTALLDNNDPRTLIEILS